MGWRVVAALVALGAYTQATPQQPPRFRSFADAVQVDVQVMRGGRPVAGLTAANFELRDTNVPQKVEAVVVEDVPVNVILALDVSGSVKGKTIENLTAAAQAAVQALTSDDRAAVLTFSQSVALATSWTRDADTLKTAIVRPPAAGGTALYDALVSAIAIREQRPGRTLVLLFTDGNDTTSWLDARAVLDAASRSDIVVYAVSPTALAAGREAAATLDKWLQDDPTLFPYAFLGRLAEDTGGERVALANERDLPGVFTRAIADFKSRYVLTFSPTGVPKTGWHPIEVKLKGKSGTVRARRGYSRKRSA
jgi:Ca-activated chloride channel family protein